MPQEQFQRERSKIKLPVQRVQKKIKVPQLQLAQETMRSEIRRTTLEKTFEEQDTLSQAVVRIVNEAARDQERQWRCRRKPNTAEVKETSRAKSAWHEESNKIATVLNNIHQFKIPAHRLGRGGSARKINKHVSDDVNKHPVENKCDLRPMPSKIKEAKDYSKSETEMVDVTWTHFQGTISIIEKEIAKNHTFLQKEIGTRNTNYVTAALIMMKISRSIVFSKQC